MPDILERLRVALADRYAVERVVFEGNSATVCLAQDLRLPRRVALKVLDPDLAAQVGPERFHREIDIAAALQHPHIVPVYDSGEADGLLFYVMPFVEGESLRDWLAREPQLPLATALRISREVGAALSYAHAHGVLHRDIKPDNIMISAGVAVVADFGIARALSGTGRPRLTGAGLAIGTPLYMSPEQASGSQDLDERSDVYSLGCVLFEMLAGRPPFVGSVVATLLHQHLTTPVPRLSTIWPGAPPAVERAIERALAKAPAERFATAAAFVAALDLPSGPPPGRRRLLARAGLVAGALAIAATLWIWLAPPTAPRLDANLVAVAPFEVRDPGLKDWHEGLMDALSHKLDGAGPLRTASQSVVLHRWRGRADAASADAMARRVGAGLVVYGSLFALGSDSVRLLAVVRDADAGRPIGDIDLRESALHMDRLTDSATVALLREVGRVRAIGAVRTSSLGSRSLPALKAFLAAEQFYRRAMWDSVQFHAQRAVQLDSTFALARRLVAIALDWQDNPPSVPEGRRAGDFNHGLGPRDSQLVLISQLNEQGDEAAGDRQRLLRRRLYAVLQDFTRRYPDDPEGWFGLGEFIHHQSAEIGIARRTEYDAWQRSIALDPAFGPSYFHAVKAALHFDGMAAARRYADAYLALDTTGIRQDWQTRGTRLVAELLDPARAWSADFVRRTAGLNADPFVVVWENLARWPDSAQSAVRAVRVAATRSSEMFNPDPAIFSRFLSLALAYRGQVGAAWAALPPPAYRRQTFADLALVGAVPADTARAVFARLRRNDDASFAPAWWAKVQDTLALAESATRWDALARADSSALVRRRAAYLRAATRAWLALARRDTAGALAGFLALRDSLCAGCAFERLERVQLLAAVRRDAEAAALLEGDLVYANQDPLLAEVFWVLERARVNERLGNRDQARTAYQYVADVWRNADPEVQRYVVEARGGLRRMR